MGFKIRYVENQFRSFCQGIVIHWLRRRCFRVLSVARSMLCEFLNLLSSEQSLVGEYALPHLQHQLKDVASSNLQILPRPEDKSRQKGFVISGIHHGFHATKKN